MTASNNKKDAKTPSITPIETIKLAAHALGPARHIAGAIIAQKWLPLYREHRYIFREGMFINVENRQSVSGTLPDAVFPLTINGGAVDNNQVIRCDLRITSRNAVSTNYGVTLHQKKFTVDYSAYFQDIPGSPIYKSDDVHANEIKAGPNGRFIMVTHPHSTFHSQTLWDSKTGKTNYFYGKHDYLVSPLSSHDWLFHQPAKYQSKLYHIDSNGKDHDWGELKSEGPIQQLGISKNGRLLFIMYHYQRLSVYHFPHGLQCKVVYKNEKEYVNQVRFFENTLVIDSIDGLTLMSENPENSRLKEMGVVDMKSYNHDLVLLNRRQFGLFDNKDQKLDIFSLPPTPAPKLSQRQHTFFHQTLESVIPINDLRQIIIDYLSLEDPFVVPRIMIALQIFYLIKELCSIGMQTKLSGRKWYTQQERFLEELQSLELGVSPEARKKFIDKLKTKYEYTKETPPKVKAVIDLIFKTSEMIDNDLAVARAQNAVSPSFKK